MRDITVVDDIVDAVLYLIGAYQFIGEIYMGTEVLMQANGKDMGKKYIS